MRACARCTIGSTRAGDSPDPFRHLRVAARPRGGGRGHRHAAAPARRDRPLRAAGGPSRPGRAARFTFTRSRRTEPERSTRSPQPPLAPDSSSSSSPTTATARARSNRRAIARACCASSRGGEHRAAAIGRARPAALAVSAGGLAARGHRGRPPSRRLWHRRASGFAERIAAMDAIGRSPFDGLEWLNADSEWRDEFLDLDRPACC